jgi:hypothetical protein
MEKEQQTEEHMLSRYSKHYGADTAANFLPGGADEAVLDSDCYQTVGGPEIAATLWNGEGGR